MDYTLKAWIVGNKTATPAKRRKQDGSDNPLWKHQSGQWCKRIRGQFVYFGTELQSALKQYGDEKASWQAGIEPRTDRVTSGEPTIAHVCNAFLRTQDGKLEIAELSPRTFHE